MSAACRQGLRWRSVKNNTNGEGEHADLVAGPAGRLRHLFPRHRLGLLRVVGGAETADRNHGLEPHGGNLRYHCRGTHHGVWRPADRLADRPCRCARHRDRRCRLHRAGGAARISRHQPVRILSGAGDSRLWQCRGHLHPPESTGSALVQRTARSGHGHSVDRGRPRCLRHYTVLCPDTGTHR